MNAPLVTAPNSGIPFASRRKEDIRRLLGDKLSTDMSPEEWDCLIAGLLKFLSEEASEPEHATDIAMDRALYAWDESVRTEDIDGRMRVATMNISKACVNPYKGDEIPGCEQLGLDPDRVYYLLRHPDELKKAAASSNGVQILRKHIPVSADDHQPWDVVGALGTDGRFEAPYLKNSGTFWVADDIAGIKSGAKKQLSLGYHYRPEMTAGKFDDIPFDGVMRDIVVNHVALVEDGRAGPDVVVGDSAEKINMPTRLAAFALMSTAAAIAPLLAMDKKIDLMPVFKDLNSKNYKPKSVFEALQKVLKGKLIAADVSMKHVADLLEHVPSEESMDESVSEAQHNAMEAAAHGHSNLGIPKKVGEEFSKADEGKDNFMGDNIYKKAMDFFAKHGDDAMTEAFKAHMGEPGGHDEENEEAEEENEGLKSPPDLEPAKDRRAAKDRRRGHDGAPMISKQAMDHAIAAANAATAKTVTERIRKEQRDLRSAEEFAAKKVGKLDAMTFDTAEQLNRHVLKMLGCDGADTIHASALHHVIAAYPDAGAKPVEHRREQRLGADAAAKKTALEFAPGLANIRIGV